MPSRTGVLIDNDVIGGPWKCSDNGMHRRKEEELNWDDIFRKRPKKIVYYKALSPSPIKKQEDEKPRKGSGTEYVDHGGNRDIPSPRSRISELDSLRDDEHDVSYMSELCNNVYTRSSSQQKASDNQVKKKGDKKKCGIRRWERKEEKGYKYK